MTSDISLLLAQVEAAVSNLEASAQTTEITASPTTTAAAAAPTAVWTFDADPIPKRKRPEDRRPRSTTDNEARYCLRKEKRKREPFVTPAPGHYNPCHEAVLRKPSGIKMVQSCTKRRQMPIANDQGNSQPVLHTQEDLGKALAASSRVQKPRGGRFGPEKGLLEKRTSRRSNRVANGPGVGQYNPSHRLVEKRTTGPSFAPPGGAKLADYVSKREIPAMNDSTPSAETMQETFMPSLERAYRATEARVKGVARWQSVTSTADIYKRPKSPSEEQNEEKTIVHEESVIDDRNFDPLKAWLASKPKRGAVAWVPTSYRKPLSPTKKNDTTIRSPQQVRLTSGFCAPSSSFAKPVEQSKQLIARNARQIASAAKLGPGAHFDESTFTSFQKSRKAGRDENTKTTTMQSLKVAKTKHRSLKPPQETPGVGTYDTQRAFTLTQSRVPGGSSSFKGPPRWPKPQGQPVAVQEDLKLTKTEDSEEATAFAVDVSHSPDAEPSSPSSERSRFTDEGKRESKCFDIDEYDSAETSSLGSRSCTSYSSSSSADSDQGMEGLAQHLLHEKPSSWARKPFMVEADARRALILQRHMRRKASEKRGSARFLHLNQEAVEPRRNTHVVSMERAEAQRAKQRAANEATRAKIKAASATRADQILEALGVDLDAAEMQADTFATTPNDPSKIKGFTYREPAPLPPQALEAQMRRELENMYRGPGTYEAATTHREWITDDDDNRPALMSRATGRERVSVRQKGALRTIAFTEADFQQQDPDLAALGPGQYQVSSRVSRFGVDKSRAPDMDRMNATSRFEEAQELDNHVPILELDAASAKERTKKKAPGAAGYAFSKLPSNRQGSANTRQQDDSFSNIDFGSGAGDEAFLDLEPDREKFKYKRTQELVPMDKLPQRFSPDKRGRGDGDRRSKDEHENEYLALDPERGRAFLRKRSRAANMSMGSPRNLLPVQFQDEIGEGDEALPVVFESEPLSRNFDAVKPRAVRHVPDFAKAPKRFPDAESESKANQPRSDYDVDAGLRITKPRQASESATVDMQRQRGRFDEEKREADRPRYLDADYAGAEKGHDCLGGRNAKGAQRRGARSLRTLVNMAKSAPRQLDAKNAKEKKAEDNSSLQTEELVLDPSRADAHVRPRHIRGVLGMDKSQPRWAEKSGNDVGKGPNSPNLVELEKGMAQLSMLGRAVHPAPKGHVDMRKQPGRQVKEAPPDILSEIDARAARDAPSQNLRVVGGVIPAADDRAAPMSAHARALAEQGNVLELNPDPTPLLKRRAAGTLAMETQTGRSSPTCDIHSPGVLMASPVHPDVRASENFLKPRVIGGAVGLETDVPKPILMHRQEERALEERTFKVNQAEKNAQLQKAIRSERKQAVARARGDKENDSGKQSRKRPQPTTKVKSGKTIPRAQKVL